MARDGQRLDQAGPDPLRAQLAPSRDQRADDSHLLFIVEQAGIIKVLQPGAVAPTIFLDITSKVLSGGEQGLLGLTFHPQYISNRRFFVKLHAADRRGHRWSRNIAPPRRIPTSRTRPRPCSS